MSFNLRVWTREYNNRPGVLKSQLYYQIADRFREKGIEIPSRSRISHKENSAAILKAAQSPNNDTCLSGLIVTGCTDRYL
jgi:small-conductance mechanosensitive channel